MTDTLPASPHDLAGRVIGGCRLARRLGHGAMGTVYLAEQTALRRTVAVKVLAPRYADDPGYTERFAREARSAAQLSHPNIVQVFDFGQEGQLFYMVNEYVDGGNVQQRLENASGGLPHEAALDYVLQAAQGLAAAQEKGVIHRDIKPENLMLSREGTVKIADFGLAKARFSEAEAAITQAGYIMGTPFYMSPEQAKNQPLDIRADLYSLGVTFYYLLTGALPFDADSVIGVLLKQISAERPNPSAANPAVPPAMGALVVRMMAADPACRPADAAELVRELERLRRSFHQPRAAAELAAAAAVDESQRKLFKPMPAALVRQVARLEVGPEALERMFMSLNADGGHFIEAAPPLPVHTAVEVRFSSPGQDEEFQGIGLVRWVREAAEAAAGEGLKAGMGVTFLKVQAVPKGGAGPAARLAGPMAIHALTRTPLLQRILRYAYANNGVALDLTAVASALGCGQRMLKEPLELFESAGLARPAEGGKIKFLWPEDPALQREIVAWMDKQRL